MTLTELFISIANAIRNKKKTTDKILATNFAREIERIETSTSEDITGELNDYNNLLTTQEQTIDKIVLALQNKTSSGDVILQEKTVIPSTVQQEITADSGYDGLSKVVMNAVTSSIDSNIKAENIKKDVSILGINGTYEGEGGITPSGEIEITSNGTYNVTNYSSAKVNVNNDVSGVDIHDYINTAPSGNASGSYSYITKNIIKLPPIDLTNVTMMRYFFMYCTMLTEVEGELDIGFSSNNTGMFGNNGSSAPTALKTIKIKNLSADLDIHYCTKLSKESLLYLLNNAQTVESGTIILGSENYAKLTANEISIATNKGWTVSES